MINKWIEINWKDIERISRRILMSRWREGISEYYTNMERSGKEPTLKHFYYFIKNLEKPNSAINYTPVGFRSGKIPVVSVDDWKATDMRIDLGNEEAVDFLTNNSQNEKWLKIYNLIYRGGLKLNLFEKILFDYVFIQALSIREIVKITGNSQDYIYKQRRALIEKIKNEI